MSTRHKTIKVIAVTKMTLKAHSTDLKVSAITMHPLHRANWVTLRLLRCSETMANPSMRMTCYCKSPGICIKRSKLNVVRMEWTPSKTKRRQLRKRISKKSSRTQIRTQRPPGVNLELKKPGTTTQARMTSLHRLVSATLSTVGESEASKVVLMCSSSLSIKVPSLMQSRSRLQDWEISTVAAAQPNLMKSLWTWKKAKSTATMTSIAQMAVQLSLKLPYLLVENCPLFLALIRMEQTRSLYLSPSSSRETKKEFHQVESKTKTIPASHWVCLIEKNTPSVRFKLAMKRMEVYSHKCFKHQVRLLNKKAKPHPRRKMQLKAIVWAQRARAT